ncbi:tRNA pseudouridine(13) synthase TruD [Alteromonas pelagimontana]|uniref:tRNA pseudouridine synthase D n=1 Tax=Alteromonas pelagimontana TaxID=1858656 RepID=A0A6M4MCM5_9ALTE|nr:tRNA pseudouridine(13) synthase TruD [Alteromonas pelagimontana]QJR80410.1 tRNA pseudouridine(13) synthase TruD [Alteromonas pelagimontana]
MKNLSTQHWQYVWDEPVATGAFKTRPEDFQVIEALGYEPAGEGEHQFLFIEKVNLNTAFVAEQLAKFTGLPLRNVTYAGRKDKFALTRQWFGLHAPGKPNFDFSGFTLPGVKICQHSRHNRKLKTGQLQGNDFVITLRHITQPATIIQRLERISSHGVPNYFGEQRFGVMRVDENGKRQEGGNLALAQRMVAGEAIRNRNKRSMALSALRSWLFNECISVRIGQGDFDNILAGDALMLKGSNSFFIEDGSDTTVNTRYQQQDLAPTAPLWGQGKLAVTAQALALESTITAAFPEVTQYLEQAGLKQERRPIKIWPERLEWQLVDDTLTLSFGLPSGCFATSVLRECVQLMDPPQTHLPESL